MFNRIYSIHFIIKITNNYNTYYDENIQYPFPRFSLVNIFTSFTSKESIVLQHFTPLA